MLARLRVVVPDRPGSLGGLASAIGAEAGDVCGVRVLDGEAGRATDDVVVSVRDPGHLERVCRRLRETPGFEVLGVRSPVPELTGHAELELVGQVLARPARGAQTFVDGAPKALDVEWAALVDLDEHGYVAGVRATSVPGPGPDAVHLPGPVRLAVVPTGSPHGAAGAGAGARAGAGAGAGADSPLRGTAVVPVGDLALGLVLVREDGYGFHTGELWRFSALARVLATALG